MCGRFNVTDDPSVHLLMDMLGIDVGPLPTRYNIAPTEQVAAIYLQDGRPTLSEMRWWLTPHWSDGPSTKYSMFNARSETAEKSRAFRGPFKYRRAIIPASSFVEWQRTASGKQPFLIQPQEGGLALGALWDYWSDGVEHILSCAILTTPATDSFKSIHNRMPVMLQPDQLKIWLDEKTDLAEIHSMLHPFEGELVATPVSTAINNGRNKEEPEVVGDSLAV